MSISPGRIWNGLYILALLAATPARAEPPKWKPIVDLRLRWEAFDTPVARADQDPSYSFGLVRVRAGVETEWSQRLRSRALVQGAAMTSLPVDAAFGTGPVYLATNGGDRTPSQAGLLELALTWQEPRFRLTVGRQGFLDGAEPPTGDPALDFVKRRRLGERLVGNLDFPNVGRRFDGATASADLGRAGALELFALRPLAGAFNYVDAFERLDIDTYGASLTGRYGQWIPDAEARVFAIGYRDQRPVARAAAEGDISLSTLGGSLLAGREGWDALAWAAIQRGSFGSRDQRAWAGIVELGYRFTGARGAPSLHLGYERASGGSTAGDHASFFNLLPTNHKFYGALDYVAFSNVRDLFLETRWNPTPKLAAGAALHDFSLVDRADAWYGGSGAMSDRELGYVARRPAAGRFASSDVGRELDLNAALSLPHKVELRLEAGRFFGGAAAREVLPRDENGSWLALELGWKL